MTSEPRTMSRRDRLRVQTFQEIEDAAFAIIDEDGVHALSIAALARSMAMSAPALYRYFASRDALVAHLITRAYGQLVAAMAAGMEGRRRTPQARVRLLVVTYREWALQYRRRYAMLFGESPGDIPEEVGAESPLNLAMTQLVDLLVAEAAEAPAVATTGDRTLDGQLREWARAMQRPGTAPRISRAAIIIWTRVHGIVSLELNGMVDNRSIDVQRLINLEVDNAVQLLTRTGS
ncbi:TetR/AcrR family transcriptional regulator [Actinoplanes sp. NPDC049265]|uniref:TetR/AcrR family transcriptional regulator n=1 Tax=Actinoplanes sp. NPDC049265 TaxID=3363902 RepID=UPI0037200D82